MLSNISHLNAHAEIELKGTTPTIVTMAAATNSQMI
jgi:hypothetical protein